MELKDRGECTCLPTSMGALILTGIIWTSIGLNISEERIHFCVYLFPLDSYFILFFGKLSSVYHHWFP